MLNVSIKALWYKRIFKFHIEPKVNISKKYYLIKEKIEDKTLTNDYSKIDSWLKRLKDVKHAKFYVEVIEDFFLKST